MTMQKTLLRAIVLVLAPLMTTACTTYAGDTPVVSDGPVAPIGNFAAIDEPVFVGTDIVVTPKAVYEDSRCPTGAQCVWGGRVVVTTRIDGPGWRETVNLVSGEAQTVRRHEFLLIEVLPAQRPQDDIPTGDYRFRFMMDY